MQKRQQKQSSQKGWVNWSALYTLYIFHLICSVIMNVKNYKWLPPFYHLGQLLSEMAGWINNSDKSIMHILR